MRPYHIFVSCFDVSADHHATRLIRYLQEIWGERVVWSVIGGEDLLTLASETDNTDFLEECATQSTVGLLEAAREIIKAPMLFLRIRRFLKIGHYGTHKSKWGAVNLFLAIDGQGRNIALGKLAHKLGIRTAYLFPPLVFVWGQWNIPKMQIFNHIFCVFKPNVDLYQKHNIKITYIGHPFIYYLMANPINPIAPVSKPLPPISHQHLLPVSKDKAFQLRLEKALKKTIQSYATAQRIKTLKHRLRLKPNQWIIGLFPGSRHQEINRLTPLFLRVITELLNRYPKGVPTPQKTGKPKYVQLRFVLALSHEHFRTKIETFRSQAELTPNTLPIIHNAYEEILSLSRIAITCSGTVTLKAAFLGTPHILTYQISWLSYWIARFLIQIPFIGMLNILEQRPVILELINKDLSLASLTEAVDVYLRDEQTLQNKRNELISLTRKLYQDKHIRHPFEEIQKELAPVIFS